MRSVVVERDQNRVAPPPNQPVANEWYAILRTDTPGLFESRIEIEEAESVEKGMDSSHTDDYNDGLRVQKPGNVVNFTIIKSKEDDNNTCGLLYQMNHCLFDMSSLSLFLSDVENALDGKLEKSETLTCFGPYSYWRFTLPWTQDGQANVDWNVNRLSGISKMAGRQAMWPEKRAKNWLRGNDQGWFGQDSSERVPLGPTGKDQKGLFGDDFAVNVEGISQLRSQHGLSAAKVAKAAQILWNVWKTGAKEAIFVGAEGARMVPVESPADLNLRLVPGPVVEVSTTRFPVSWQDTTLQFLNKVQDDQKELSNHCRLHKGHMASALPSEDKEFLIELGGRQVFNWAPKVPHSRTKIHLIKFEGRSDIGVSWVFRMSIDPNEEELLILEVSWDNAQLTYDEATLATRQLLSAAQWLSNPVNANRPIKECIIDANLAYQYDGKS